MSERDDTPQPNTETSSDLEQLRDILYGNRTQVTEQRLNELERRLEAIYQELQNSLGAQNAPSSDTGENQFKETEENLSQASAGIYQRLGQQIGDLRQQLADFRTESRQRDAELRQELLRLGDLLARQNIGHTDLIDLLVELSRKSKENRQDRPSS